MGPKGTFMSSDRQLAANRGNARKSTGPKTEAGRAAVRLNAVKHGLTATTVVLDGESRSAFDALFTAVHAEHRPATPTEDALVTQVAMAIWRLRRFYHMEAGFLTIRLVQTADQASHFTGLEHGHRLGLVAYADAQNANALTNLSRYEVRVLNSMIKSLQLFHYLRALRPVEAKVEKQTQSSVAPTPSAAPGPDPQPESPQKDSVPAPPDSGPDGRGVQ